MSKQAQLFSLELIERRNGHEIIKSANFSERNIVRDIMHLYNHDQPFDVVLTYSTGHLYYDLPRPRIKFDLKPQAEGVVCADARFVPLASESVRSVLFDPPYLLGERRPETIGKIGRRFTRLRSLEYACKLYRGATEEAWRILRGRGLFVFKIQDIIEGGQPIWNHIEIVNHATALGFIHEDEFLRLADSPIISPNQWCQKHARKVHVFYLVFRKGAGGRRRRN